MGHSVREIPRAVRRRLKHLAQKPSEHGRRAYAVLLLWETDDCVRLGVPHEALEELQALAPSRPHYALGAKPGSARTARGWNVIVPVDVAERDFEGL